MLLRSFHVEPIRRPCTRIRLQHKIRFPAYSRRRQRAHTYGLPTARVRNSNLAGPQSPRGIRAVRDSRGTVPIRTCAASYNLVDSISDEQIGRLNIPVDDVRRVLLPGEVASCLDDGVDSPGAVEEVGS